MGDRRAQTAPRREPQHLPSLISLDATEPRRQIEPFVMTASLSDSEREAKQLGAQLLRHNSEMGMAGREEVEWLRRELARKDELLQKKDEQFFGMLKLPSPPQQQRASERRQGNSSSEPLIGDDMVRQERDHVRNEIQWLRNELRAVRAEHRDALREKDELMRNELRAKDEQMREILQAKDKQMQAKDEMLMALLEGSPRLHDSLQPPLQTAPVTKERQRRQAHLRAKISCPATVISHPRADVEQQSSAPNDSSGIAQLTSVMTMQELQFGGKKSELTLAVVLNHGLEVLEAMPQVPRENRRTVRLLCEQVENVLEEVDEKYATRLAECQKEELEELHGALLRISSLQIGAAGLECVEIVGSLLSTLKLCTDPLMSAIRTITSDEASVRMRGLEVLRALPCVVLAESVEAEVSVVSMVGDIGINLEQHSQEERLAAKMAVFILCFRNVNGAATLSIICKMYLDPAAKVIGAMYSGQLHEKEFASFNTLFILANELGTKGEHILEQTMMKFSASIMKLDCTAERYAEVLPGLLELAATDEDIVLASGAFQAIAIPLITSGPACADIALNSIEQFLQVTMALIRRICGPTRRPATWWKEQAQSVNLIDVCLNSMNALANVVGIMPHLPQPESSNACEELLSEGIYLLEVNREAELSATARMQFWIFKSAAAIVSVAAREQSRHESLLASGVVNALLYTTAHNFQYIGSGFAEYSAAASVALIGRNEGGLTLTREAVDVVPTHQMISTPNL